MREIPSSTITNTKMLTRFAFSIAIVVATLTSAPHATADFITIDFDGTGAPGLFSQTSALRNLFEEDGLNFFGPGENDGGAILNQSGNFGIDARSGTDFLAFNRGVSYSDGGIATDPETLRFDGLVDFVSIWAGGGGISSFTMEAFLGDTLIATETITAPAEQWTELSISIQNLSGVTGFDSVVLTGDGLPFFVFDDVSFNTVPEPGSTLLIAAASMFTLVRRRK